MIVQVDRLGSDRSNMCRANVTIPFGTVGVKLVSINLPYNAGSYSPAFVAGVELPATSETIDVPAFGAFSDLRKWFNTLRRASGARVFYAYGTNEFDLCSAAAAVNLSPAFADYLGLDEAMVANACYTTTFDVEQADPVHDYVVKFIAPIRDQTLGAVHSTTGDAYSNVVHRFVDQCEFGEVEVYCRLKDGQTVPARCADDIRWSVELEF